MAENTKFQVDITGQDETAGAFASIEASFRKLGLTAEQVEAEIKRLEEVNEEDGLAQHYRAAEVELRRLGLTSAAVQKEMAQLQKLKPIEEEAEKHMSFYERTMNRLSNFRRHEEGGEEGGHHEGGEHEGGEHEAHGWDGVTAHFNILRSHFGELRENVGETRESLADMFPMLAGFGAIASAAGLVELIHSTAEEQAQLEAMSKQLGIGTEQLEAFHYAANMSDVPIDVMDKSMAKLGVTIQEVVSGHDKAGAAIFEKMGIHLRDAHGHLVPMTTILPEVAQALKNTADPQMRLFVATELFGKAGRDMLPLLIQGRDHFEDLTREAEKLGPALTDLDRDHLEQFNDAWKQAQYVSESFMTKLGADLAPVMTPLLDDFTDFVAANKAWIAEDVAGAVQATANAIKDFPWDPAIAGAKAFAGDVADVATGINDLVQYIPGGWKTVIEGFAIYKAASPFAHMIADGMRLLEIGGKLVVLTGEKLPAALSVANTAWGTFSAAGVAAFKAIQAAEMQADGAFRQTLLGKTMAVTFAVAEAADSKVAMTPAQQKIYDSFHLQPGQQLTSAERAKINAAGPSIDSPAMQNSGNGLNQAYDAARRLLFGSSAPQTATAPIVPIPGGRDSSKFVPQPGAIEIPAGRDSTVHVQVTFNNAPANMAVTTTSDGSASHSVDVGYNKLGGAMMPGMW